VYITYFFLLCLKYIVLRNIEKNSNAKLILSFYSKLSGEINWSALWNCYNLTVLSAHTRELLWKKTVILIPYYALLRFHLRRGDHFIDTHGCNEFISECVPPRARNPISADAHLKIPRHKFSFIGAMKKNDPSRAFLPLLTMPRTLAASRNLHYAEEVCVCLNVNACFMRGAWSECQKI
jgi:hypothetical protein